MQWDLEANYLISSSVLELRILRLVKIGRARMGLGLLLDLGYMESAWKMGSVPASPVSPGASLGLVQ